MCDLLIKLWWLWLLNSAVAATKVHYVHWNSSNPLFSSTNAIYVRSDETSSGHKYEQANIICPIYHRNVPLTETERYIVYNVSKREFNQCKVNNSSAKIVALCDSPYKPSFFTLTFRAFSPIPGAFEFHPGQNYYFISTSSKSDLFRRVGGRCMSHHMKLVFKIRNSKHKKKKRHRNSGKAQPVQHQNSSSMLSFSRVSSTVVATCDPDSLPVATTLPLLVEWYSYTNLTGYWSIDHDG